METHLTMAGEEEIQIPDVHEELAKLGMEVQKKGEIRGCLFNLIVYSQDVQRSVFLKEIVESVTDTFPCRIIFIECDTKTKQNFLKVTVDEEVVKKDGSAISSDRINIKCTEKYLNHVPSIVLPHFIPDLPIYLLWGQDPVQDNAILPFLYNYASRMIFDTDSACDIRTFCQKMLTDPIFKKIPITDMNWASLTSWREILYQVFDSPEKIDQLRNSRQITIRYNNKESEIYQHAERRAVYLQGWLAAQLGWQYKNSSLEKNLLKIGYQNKNPIEIALVGENFPELTPGAIVNVEIRTENDSLYDLSRPSIQPFILAHITLKDVCELPFTLPLRHSKKGLIFMNEIFFGPCQETYWNMLKAIEPLQVPC
jgi:glucose-6-phosphate dehydrogenase assembly protein OpcA